MNSNSFGRGVLASAKKHPWRAAAIAVTVLASSVAAGATMASAQPQPMLAVASSALHATPSPHVLNFAAQPVGKRIRLHGHAKSVKQAWNIDGCDHDYGTANQCVPWKVPGATAHAKCAWLQSNGFGPLAVPGKNRQGLPESTAGVACPANV